MLKSFLIDLRCLLINLLFPITCLVCETEGEFICGLCLRKFKRAEHQRCIICQKPAIQGLTHPVCRTRNSADALISFYDYHDENFSKTIIAAKYQFIFEIFNIFGKVIAPQIQLLYNHILNSSPILVPVPLHASRKRWRGFNQSEVLCESLSAELSLKVEDVLQRTKITKTQKNLNKENRIKNIKDAFALSPLFSKETLAGKSFILVDDVTTTGTTLNEAAKILKQNGAKSVICLTIARD